MTKTADRTPPLQHADRTPPIGDNRGPPLLGDEEELLDVEAAPLPTDADISKVRELAQAQATLEDRIAKGEALLKKLKEAHKLISEQQLPVAMKALGMRKFTMVGGAEVEVKAFIAASVPKPKTDEVFQAVEKMGHGSIIKHAITIVFGRDEEKWAAKFMRDMAQRKKPLNHTRKDWIEPSTYGKFIRDQVAALRQKGTDPYTVLPKETFGIYEGEAAEIKLPDKPPEELPQI